MNRLFRDADSGQENTIICPHCGKRYYGLTSVGHPYQYVCGPTAGCGKPFAVNPMPAIQLTDQQAVDFYDRYIAPNLQKKQKQEAPLPDIEQQLREEAERLYPLPEGLTEYPTTINTADKKLLGFIQYVGLTAYISGRKASLSKSFTEDEIDEAMELTFENAKDYTMETLWADLRTNLKSKKEGV